MGNSQSAAPRTGGANLPPELLNMIGEYADGDTVARMRRTGKDGLAVSPVVPSDTAKETWKEPWMMFHYDNVVDELWANDNRNTRYAYVKMLEKDGDSCVGYMMHIIWYLKTRLEYEFPDTDGSDGGYESQDDAARPEGFPVFKYVHHPVPTDKYGYMLHDYVPAPEPDYILDLHKFEAKRNTIMFILDNPYTRSKCNTNMQQVLLNELESAFGRDMREGCFVAFLLRNVYNVKVTIPSLRQIRSLQAKLKAERQRAYDSDNEEHDESDYQ